jgi:hypothetical protein
MGLLQTIILVGVLAVVAWFFFWPHFEFRIRISDGSLRLATGKVTRDFLEQLTAVCRHWDIKRGWIGGVRRGRRLTLSFSRSVPSGCRQQIRNLWANR